MAFRGGSATKINVHVIVNNYSLNYFNKEISSVNTGSKISTLQYLWIKFAKRFNRFIAKF